MWNCLHRLISMLVKPNKLESLRQQFREAALRYTYFMAVCVLGYKDFCPRIHIPMCNFLDADEYPTKVLLEPRGWFKSSAVRAKAVRKIAANPDVRILYANEVERNSVNFMDAIADVFRRCEFFLWLFPEFDVSRFPQDSVEGFTVPRRSSSPQSTIRPAGLSSVLASQHYDWIICDDIYVEGCAESDALADQCIKFTEKLPPLLDPGGHIDYIGTRWNHRDVYKYLADHDRTVATRNVENHTPIAWRITSACDVLPGGRLKSRFPELRPTSYYEAERLKNPYLFSCIYQNKPEGRLGDNLQLSLVGRAEIIENTVKLWTRTVA